MTQLEAIEQETRVLQLAKDVLIKGTNYSRLEREKKYFFITENYPTFVDKVNDLIYRLGSLKLSGRDLIDLDRAKNRAYKLINL